MMVLKMKKIYCRKCGYKVFDSDTEYCPRCGTRLNDYAEVKSIEKSRKTRNILLACLLIVVIAFAGVLTYTMFFNEQYQTVNVSASATLELPVGNGLNTTIENGILTIKNGKGVVITSYNSNQSSLTSGFAFASVKSVAVGDTHNDNQIHETTINGKTVYSISIFNDTTHDNIIITTPNKDLTLKIADSVKYNTNIANNTNNTNGTSNNMNNGNNKHIYGYADDGTPFYSQAELEKYVMSKGGYASLDEYYAVQRGDQQAINNYDARKYVPESTTSSSGSSDGGSQSGGSSGGGSATPT